MKTRPLVIILAALLLGACGAASEMPEARVGDAGEKPPNFIVLIGDDMGVETLSCYPVGKQTAKTPTLDNLCDNGMRFDNFWSQPVCSPTRATILTGQYGFRNGVGTPVNSLGIDFPQPALPANAPREVGAGNQNRRAAGGRRSGRGGQRQGGQARAQTNTTDDDRPSIRQSAYGLPVALSADRSLGYQSAAIGKWHLASADNGGLDHPAIVGFDHYAGSISGGGVESYYAWSKVVDGQITNGQTGYVTTDTVNDALRWVEGRDPARPWLLWVAFNAPHTPFTQPPASLLSESTNEALDAASNDQQLVYRAMIEAMDTEIGRLLSSIPEEELANTYVVFLGDNGTPNQVRTPPFGNRRVKGTVYQGGINVPLIVAGPKVTPGSRTQSLANSVDLFATILDLAGTATDATLNTITLDAVSLAPVLKNPEVAARNFAYADAFGPQRNGYKNERAIRDTRYKLLVDEEAGTEALYDLEADPYEAKNLLDGELDSTASNHYEQLTTQLDSLSKSKAP